MADEKLSRQTLLEMARLAGVTLDEQTLMRMQPDLDTLLGNIGILQALDLSNVEPAVTFFPKQLEQP